MKRVITAARRERDYEVEVSLKFSRVHPGQPAYLQTWVLTAYNAEHAKEIAEDILAGMSPIEIFNDFSTDEAMQAFCAKYNADPDSYIGYELASRGFKLEASRA